MCFEYHTKNGANSTTLTRGEVETRESQTRGLSVNSVADSLWVFFLISRGGCRTAATSKMERFVIIVNGRKTLTIITMRSILDVAAVGDLLLFTLSRCQVIFQ